MNFGVVFYEFSEDCFGINDFKDEMTVVLVKG